MADCFMPDNFSSLGCVSFRFLRAALSWNAISSCARPRKNLTRYALFLSFSLRFILIGASIFLYLTCPNFSPPSLCKFDVLSGHFSRFLDDAMNKYDVPFLAEVEQHPRFFGAEFEDTVFQKSRYRSV